MPIVTLQQTKDLEYFVRRIVEEVIKLAEAYPCCEYLRTSTFCKYTEGQAHTPSGNAPEGEGCIIGRAIIAARPEASQELSQIDKGPCPVQHAIVRLWHKASNLSRDAILTALAHDPLLHKQSLFLRYVQDQQDAGEPWCVAVDNACRELGLESTAELFTAGN